MPLNRHPSLAQAANAVREVLRSGKALKHFNAA
jgi:hypothetical protein